MFTLNSNADLIEKTCLIRHCPHCLLHVMHVDNSGVIEPTPLTAEEHECLSTLNLNATVDYTTLESQSFHNILKSNIMKILRSD